MYLNDPGKSHLFCEIFETLRQKGKMAYNQTGTVMACLR